MDSYTFAVNDRSNAVNTDNITALAKAMPAFTFPIIKYAGTINGDEIGNKQQKL